ncbi:alpha/beta fold hydrolase [Mycobacterium sp. NPDC006124]|uniref:alpha/beta fold hydrolase n=1 Tax=Mycobacterium sp. NPDC006124 TaxID=3156729 RepID=UPI0033BEABE0
MSLYVLVPGAGGSAWYWHRLVPLLTQHGHTAVAVELPASDDHAYVSDYVDAAVDQALRAQARSNQSVIVLGQSMGGFVAPSVALELGARELVLLNAMIPRPGERVGEWFSNTGQPAAAQGLAREEGRPPHDGVDPVDDMFNDVPQHVVDEAFRAGEPLQSQTPFADSWPPDAWPDIATRVLAARSDRMFPFEFQQRVAADRLNLEVHPVPGGHLAALGRPDELLAALLATSS